MQNFPKGGSPTSGRQVASGRRRLGKTDATDSVVVPVPGSIVEIAGEFGTVYTAAVTVPAASVTQPDAADAATVPPIGSPTSETPPMTRRELRQREARAAASRPLLFPPTSSVPPPARAAGATDDEVREAAAVDGVRPRRTKVTRRSARRAGTPRAPRGRATRPARPTKPATKPRVAATVTATSSAPVGRIAGAKRRILSQLATVGAMAGVCLILVATTVPANAFFRPVVAPSSVEPLEAGATAKSADRTQELEVAAVPAPTVTRDGYTVISQQQQTAAKYGNQLLLYTNNPSGTIQWPFPTGVPITSGFGGRKVAGCGFCSTNHLGVDFTPGAGTPIQSIADGTVSLVELSSSGLGNHVMVDHVVNGQKVQSVYAHMQYGSIKVAEGQRITVGQQIGSVGSTGASTGAHLHLEVHLDGTPVDPFAWLKANAN